MNTVEQSAPPQDPRTLLGPGRLTFNEQLCLFASSNEIPTPRASLGMWAVLALALAVVPWALVGLAIWLFS